MTSSTSSYSFSHFSNYFELLGLPVPNVSTSILKGSLNSVYNNSNKNINCSSNNLDQINSEFDYGKATKAFRRLALLYHPDKNIIDSSSYDKENVNKANEAAAKFVELKKAYEILMDDTRRLDYTKKLLSSLNGNNSNNDKAIISKRQEELEKEAQRAAQQIKKKEKEFKNDPKEELKKVTALQEAARDDFTKVLFSSLSSSDYSIKQIENDMMAKWEVDNWDLIYDKEKVVLSKIMKNVNKINSSKNNDRNQSKNSNVEIYSKNHLSTKRSRLENNN